VDKTLTKDAGQEGIVAALDSAGVATHASEGVVDVAVVAEDVAIFGGNVHK